jgi:GntR family transcriptional regulator, vanillate catabolism transcriptional regulator
VTRRLSSDSLTIRALTELRAMLRGGAFAPGERLRERVLVDRLGVSRSPLRLALAMLQHEGLVELLAQGGYVVRAFTSEAVADNMHMRGVLEGTAARLAAERGAGRRDLVVELAQTCDAMQAALGSWGNAESVARYFESDKRFHTAIVQLAASPALTRLLESTLTLPFSASGGGTVQLARGPTAERLLVMQSHHRALVEAIAAGEGTRAESVAREHWRSFSNAVQSHMKAAARIAAAN